MAEAEGESLLLSFRRELSDAEQYLEPSEGLRAGCLSGITCVFKCLKESSGSLPTGPLEQLYTDEFDEEQVWEELQLLNEPALRRLGHTVGRLGQLGSVTLMEGGLLGSVGSEDEAVEETGQDSRSEDIEGLAEKEEEEEEEEEEEKEEEEEEEEEEEGWLQEEEEEEEEEGKGTVVERQLGSSQVDDQFFKLAEMEQFVEEAAANLSDPGSEGSVGLLADVLSDSGSDPQYEDFFDPPREEGGGKGSSEGPTLRGLQEEGGQERLSAYEKRRLKLQEQIQALETSNVAERPWQMSGEVSSRDRPLNSLLEEVLNFDPMSQPPPVITEEITRSLEDIIRQRIFDQAWDDVERKLKPLEKPFDYQRSRPLDQEKSKRSLAEVYEEEYLKQTQERSVGEEGEEDPRHAEVRDMMKTLFLKLDALSNFHFTPKPPQPEVKVVGNVPAVTMEEVVPQTTSQSSLLAPEEIHAKPRHPEKGESEKTAADKRRQRVAKKRLKKQRAMERQKRSGVSRQRGLKASRRAKREGVGSSSQFFVSLQQQVKEQVSNKHQQKGRAGTTTAGKTGRTGKTGTHFKL